MKYIIIVFIAICTISLSFNLLHAKTNSEKNILKFTDIIQEKIKSSQDEKNVISESDDRDEDNFVKNSENSLNDDAFDFELHPDPYDERDL